MRKRVKGQAVPDYRQITYASHLDYKKWNNLGVGGMRSYPQISLSWAFFYVFLCQEHRSEKIFQKNAFSTNCP